MTKSRRTSAFPCCASTWGSRRFSGLGAWKSGRDAQLKTLVLQGKIDAPNVGAVSEEEAALLDEYRAYKALSPAEQHQERLRLSQALGWEPHWIKDWVWNEERQALVKKQPSPGPISGQAVDVEIVPEPGLTELSFGELPEPKKPTPEPKPALAATRPAAYLRRRPW